MKEIARVGLRARLRPDTQAEWDEFFAKRAAGFAGMLDRIEAHARAILLKEGYPDYVGSFDVAPDGSWRERAPGEAPTPGSQFAFHPALVSDARLTITGDAAAVLDELRWFRPWLDKNADCRRAAIRGFDLGWLAAELSIRSGSEADTLQGIASRTHRPRSHISRRENATREWEERLKIIDEIDRAIVNKNMKNEARWGRIAEVYMQKTGESLAVSAAQKRLRAYRKNSGR